MEPHAPPTKAPRKVFVGFPDAGDDAMMFRTMPGLRSFDPERFSCRRALAATGVCPPRHA
jgi:hypothetical protein